MKIAICDDDQNELRFLLSILDSYRQSRAVSLHCDAFHSASELLDIAKSGAYDLYLLDVVMPGVNGMETAKKIRGFDQNAGIVFLTASPEFAVESNQYQAQDYLLKPAKAERLYALLDCLFAKMRTSQESLEVKTKSGTVRILFEKLAFLEVMGRYLYFHMADGSVRETLAPLAEFEELLLARPEFVRTHRSYIVNLLQLAELCAGEATTLTGAKVPVARQNYAKVREAYIAQLFAKSGVK